MPTRKPSARADGQSSPARAVPVFREELLLAALAYQKLDTKQIAELLNLSLPTVRAALRGGPGTKLHTFAAICDLAGLALSDVMPPPSRKRKRVTVNAEPPRWERGAYFSENARALQEERERKKLLKKKW